MRWRLGDDETEAQQPTGALHFLCCRRSGRGGVGHLGSMGVALKWFPDKRGLAAGITAAAFGSGTAFQFIPLIARRTYLKSDGYRTTFPLPTCWFLSGILRPVRARNSCAAYKLGEVVTIHEATGLLTGARFYAGQMLPTVAHRAYTMMFVLGVGGLMVTANLAKLADTFKIESPPLQHIPRRPPRSDRQ